MQIIDRLNLIIAKRHLLNHMFYQAWSNGELSRDILQRYAAQYYHQVQSFPRFISRVHTGCDQIEARKVLLENLVDEEIHGTDHPALWMQFAEGMGVTRATVLSEAAIPETNPQKAAPIPKQIRESGHFIRVGKLNIKKKIKASIAPTAR